MQRKLPGYQISSADIKALAGKDADFQAIKIALKHDVIVVGHTARQLTTQMYEQADSILIMEPSQTGMVAGIHPPARSETMLFAQWLPKKTVPDPYKQSSKIFEAVFGQPNVAADT